MPRSPKEMVEAVQFIPPELAKSRMKQTGDAFVLQVMEDIQEMVQITSHGEDLRGGEAGASRTSPTAFWDGIVGDCSGAFGFAGRRPRGPSGRM